MERLEHSIVVWAEALKVFLEWVSLLCVFLGLLTTVYVIVKQNRRSRTSLDALGRIRLNFGRWLSLALEFQLGADIVNTTVAPTADALIRLGAIAIIRTFLNYFLSKELEQDIKAAEQSRSEPAKEMK